MKRLQSPEFLSQLDLVFDKEANLIFGVYKGYPVYISEYGSGNNSQYAINTSAIRDGLAPDKELLKELKKYGTESISRTTLKDFKVTAWVKKGVTKKKQRNRIADALDDLINFLKERSFVPACEETGNTSGLKIYSIGGECRILSQEAYSKYISDTDAAREKENQTTENVVAGTAGALIGSLLGVAAIVLFGQLNYVVWLSGLIMGVGVVKGYELLAKKFSVKGAVICFIIAAGMTYFANDLDLAVSLSRQFSLNIFDSFNSLPGLKSNPEFMRTYWFNLILQAIFTLVTAGFTIYTALKDSRNKFVIRELSAEEQFEQF